jgi:transaldolase
MNPLIAIRQFDQSIWLDFIRRKILINGELQRRIADEALRGVTSNPAIFEKAIGGSDDYDSAIRALALQGRSTDEIYTALAVADVQHACDLFRPLYDGENNASDGYVSLEVSPLLVNDTEGTVEEGRRLWEMVARPNVMIKVPATLEGLPAIRRLIAEGINVNVTLIFGLERYRLVTEAFLAGLEDRMKAGLPLARIDSVASFFLSRIDVLIDPDAGKNGGRRRRAGRLGTVAGGRSGPGQRQAGLPDVPGNFCRPALGGPPGPRRRNPALAVGQHRQQKPEIRRPEVRREPHRPENGEYSAGGNAGHFPRARPARRAPRRRPGPSPRSVAPPARARPRLGESSPTTWKWTAPRNSKTPLAS